MKKIDEKWKKTNFSGYEVSDYGRIRTNKCQGGNGFKKNYRFIKGGIDKDGYKTCLFLVNGKRFYRRTHRMVATAFIPNPENKPQVNHKNGIKSDNRVENLEWCTISENRNHAYSFGLQKGPLGTINGMSIFSDLDLIKIKHLLNIMSDTEISEIMNCDRKTINNFRNKKTYKNFWDQ